jgi:hypothetical protein
MLLRAGTNQPSASVHFHQSVGSASSSEDLDDTIAYRPGDLSPHSESPVITAKMNGACDPWGLPIDRDPFTRWPSRESSPERKPPTSATSRDNRPASSGTSVPPPGYGQFSSAEAKDCIGNPFVEVKQITPSAPEEGKLNGDPTQTGPMHSTPILKPPGVFEASHEQNMAVRLQALEEAVCALPGRKVPLSDPQEMGVSARLQALENSIQELSAKESKPSSMRHFKLEGIKPQPFHGYGHSAKDFLRGFELFCDTQGVPPFKKAGYFALLLKSSAANWYFQLSHAEQNDYNLLKESFIQRFHDPNMDALKMQTLLQKEMQSGDNIELYINEMSKLCSELALSDKEKLSFFLRGLFPEIKQYVLRQAPLTLAAAETAARLYASTAALTAVGPPRTQHYSAGPSVDDYAQVMNRINSLQQEVQTAGNQAPPDASEQILAKLGKMEHLIGGFDRLNSRIQHLERWMACNPQFREPRSHTGGVLCSRCNGNHHESRCQSGSWQRGPPNRRDFRNSGPAGNRPSGRSNGGPRPMGQGPLN